MLEMMVLFDYEMVHKPKVGFSQSLKTSDPTENEPWIPA